MASHSHWCHQCRSRVSPLPSPLPLCPSCHDGFLEEIGSPPSLPRFLDLASANFPGFREGLRRRSLPTPRSDDRPLIVQILEMMAELAPPSVRDLHRNMHFLETMLGGVEDMQDISPERRNELLSRRAHFDDGEGVLDVADIFLRSGLEARIQRSAERDAGRYGSAPASKSAVEAMPVLKLTKQTAKGDNTHCAVCKEAFEMGGEVRQMPCEHIYHSHCILPWLRLHSTCPLCRREMVAESSTCRQPRSSEASFWPPEFQ